MTQPSPAEQFRTAEERVRMGDQRIDISLRSPIRELLNVALDTVEVYPELGDGCTQDDCEDFACDLVTAALAVARAITGDTP